MLRKVISGGQAGWDVAALRAAKAVGLRTGGWMPKGFLTVQGPRPQYGPEYGIVEHESADWAPRTFANVRDSDRTVIFTNSETRGTQLTLAACAKYGRPSWVVPVRLMHGELQNAEDKQMLGTPEAIDWYANALWAHIGNAETLNVAGNRLAHFEGPAERFLRAVFAEVMRRQSEQAGEGV